MTDSEVQNSVKQFYLLKAYKLEIKKWNFLMMQKF